MALLQEHKEFGGAPVFDCYYKCDGCGKMEYPANQFNPPAPSAGRTSPPPPPGWLEMRETDGTGEMSVKHYCKVCVKRMAEEMTP